MQASHWPSDQQERENSLSKGAERQLSNPSVFSQDKFLIEFAMEVKSANPYVNPIAMPLSAYLSYQFKILSSTVAFLQYCAGK